MANTSQVYTGIYTGEAIQESVMNLIYQRSPEDTPLTNVIMNGGGMKRATNVKHEWLYRTRGARAGTAGTTIAVETGADFTSLALALDVARPTRDINYCEIFRQLVWVDGTTLPHNFHGIPDIMADQLDFRMVDFAITIEERLFNGTQGAGPASAGATTAWTLGGLEAEITTNTKNEAGAGTLTEAEFKGELDGAWVNGGKPQDLFSGPNVRNIIDAYSGGGTKYLDWTNEQKVFATVKVYENATQNIFLHLTRDLNDTLGTADLVYVDRRFLALAWLVEPFVEKLPRLRDGELARIQGQVTLEFGDEAVHGEILNILA